MYNRCPAYDGIVEAVRLPPPSPNRASSIVIVVEEVIARLTGRGAQTLKVFVSSRVTKVFAALIFDESDVLDEVVRDTGRVL